MAAHDRRRAGLVTRLRNLASKTDNPRTALLLAEAADQIKHDGVEMRYLISGDEG